MSKKSHPIFASIRYFLFLSRFIFLFVHVNSQPNDQEQAVLLGLKQHWQNPPPLNHWTSSSNSSYCTWPEVNCTDSSVTGLNLSNMNISGTIPPFVCDLKNLTVLNFANNNINGTFPVSLYNCSKLQFLDLSQNYFVGVVPDDIDRMAQLTDLNLCANNFSGNIPAAIGQLSELKTLQLHQNQFNGTFPPEIGNLNNLQVLYMAHNGFVPSRLPSSFTQLKKLKELWISEANLFGEIPESIGDMVALELLDLSSNNLTGNIPSNVFKLKSLTLLYLYKNKLSGEIPHIIEAFNLLDLDLSDNSLTGTIPDDIGKLEKLTGLSLFFNQLSGEIHESIGRLPSLRNIKLFSNNLSGPLPPEFGRHSPLEGFQVASNRLTGGLPEYLCNGGKLVGVIAFDNNLSGELPSSLGNCSSLQIVRISNNAFSGQIPAGLWTAFNLSQLDISNNLFSDELPDVVSSNLSRLEISNNRFSGKIPAGVGSWRSLVVFNAGSNLFTGTIPSELTALPRLTTLFLDNNQLTGPPPSNIISWKALTFLNLSRNQLSGQIPEKISSLPVLSVLDLSNNQFSGQIPYQLGSRTLTTLNLSSNHLTGEVPAQFDNSVYANSFLNNPGLCASSPYLNLNDCNSELQKSNRLSTRVLALISATLVVVFALALVLSFFIIRSHRRRNQGYDSKWEVRSFQRSTFDESIILSGLTENNLIGSGGSGKVYRVNYLGSSLAVKRIWNNRKIDQKLEKEFRAEVEILGTIRHLNIVKLLCCISNDSSRLLVYEYQENGSLDQWLHMKKKTTSVSASVHHVVLDWNTRLQIAVGAAQGLSYMHHDCVPAIVHRDVKSSNILLDSEFNAKIADFGLAKMLQNLGEPASVSAVTGSFGYIAPEYARTAKVNEKIDVYSFGVVLLELTTGKQANDGDENRGLAEWVHHHIKEGKPIADLLDKDIMEPGILDEISRVFKLGISCTSTLPSERPSMKEVLRILVPYCHPVFCADKILGSEYEAAPLLKNSKRERLSEKNDASALASNV